MGQRNRLWDLISKAFKQSLSLGSTLVKKLEELLSYRFFCPNSLSLKIRLSFFPQLQGGHLSHERDLFPDFRETEKWFSVPLASTALYFKIIHMPMRHPLGPPILGPNTHHQPLSEKNAVAKRQQPLKFQRLTYPRGKDDDAKSLCFESHRIKPCF